MALSIAPLIEHGAPLRYLVKRSEGHSLSALPLPGFTANAACPSPRTPRPAGSCARRSTRSPLPPPSRPGVPRRRGSSRARSDSSGAVGPGPDNAPRAFWSAPARSTASAREHRAVDETKELVQLGLPVLQKYLFATPRLIFGKIQEHDDDAVEFFDFGLVGPCSAARRRRGQRSAHAATSLTQGASAAQSAHLPEVFGRARRPSLSLAPWST